MKGAQSTGVQIRPGSPLTILGNQFGSSANRRPSMDRGGHQNPIIQMTPVGTQGAQPKSSGVLITPGGKRGHIGPSGREILELTKRAKLDNQDQQIELSTAVKKPSVSLQPATSQTGSSANVTIWKGPPPQMEIMSTSKDGGLFNFKSQQQDRQEISQGLHPVSPQLHPQHGKIKIKRYTKYYSAPPFP